MVKTSSTYTFHLSPSGKWAYGMAYGHVNRHAWVRAADLKHA